MLSRGMKLGDEIAEDEIIDKLEAIGISDYIIVSVLKHMSNPPAEPNMVKMAPIMKALFPDVEKAIKDSYANEADITQWTRKANELLMHYQIDDQVRRDIIQGIMTYYMINELRNQRLLEDWIQRGGLR